MGPLLLEALAGGEASLAQRLGVLLVAPEQGLAIQIRVVGEVPPLGEVLLNEVEISFYLGFAIGVTEFVGQELEPETLSEGIHLRRHHRGLAGAVSDNDAGVVDHDSRARSREKLQTPRQKILAHESREATIEPQVAHARVTQFQRRCLIRSAHTADFKLDRRRVVLHLDTGAGDVLTGRLARVDRAAQLVGPAEPRHG